MSPRCETCGKVGPTIDRRCDQHLKPETQAWLDALLKLEEQPWPDKSV